jgi:hypothetical protein
MEALGSWVPRSFALDVTLLQSHDVWLYLSGGRAAPTGVELVLWLRLRAGELDPNEVFPHAFESEGTLLFGGEFSDGSKFMWLDPRWERQLAKARSQRGGANPPTNAPWYPSLRRQRWNGSSDRECGATLLLTPLPTPGPLRLVSAWPAHNLPERATTVETTGILAAASQAIQPWPEDQPSGIPRDDTELTPMPVGPHLPSRPEGRWFVENFGDLFPPGQGPNNEA